MCSVILLDSYSHVSAKSNLFSGVVCKFLTFLLFLYLSNSQSLVCIRFTGGQVIKTQDAGPHLQTFWFSRYDVKHANFQVSMRCWPTFWGSCSIRLFFDVLYPLRISWFLLGIHCLLHIRTTAYREPWKWLWWMYSSRTRPARALKAEPRRMTVLPEARTTN